MTRRSLLRSHLARHILFPLMLIAMSMTAFADGPPTTAEIFGATGATDKSVAVFNYVLGDFFLHPLSAFGGSSTLVGGLFVIFNGFVFAVGTLWASYGILAGIVETAHSGEVLGKRLSAVWLPIRMVTGLTGVAPIFGGYSLSQVFIVTMAALGIGIANMMWSGAIAMTGGFNTLIPPSAAMAAASPTSIDSAAMGIFRAQVCSKAQSYLAAQNASIDANGVSIMHQVGNIWFAARFGSPNDPTACGSVTLRGLAVRDRSSATGFRVSSVNYDAYKSMATQLQSVSATALENLNNTISGIADRWHTQYIASITDTTPLPPYPQADIEAAAAVYQSTVLGELQAMSALQKAGNPTLSDDVRAKMTGDGWFGAGAWFSTFAEANAAMSDVMRTVSIEVAGPTEAAKYTPSIASTLVAIENAQNKTASVSVGGVSSVVSDTDHFVPIKAGLCKSLGISSATDNCSIGQSIVEKGIQAAAIGSGGGGSGFFDDIGLINPIVMFKNMGDYSMVIAESIYAMMELAESAGLSDSGDGKGGGVMSTIAKAGTSLASKTGVGAVLVAAVKGSMRMLAFIAGPLLLIGLVMSIYIPMIPFITWMGGLVQYCVIVMQGLVGAPIAALSHMDAEGEGLGRRTEAGYMFALNVTFRPALMLLGFFFASALMIALGSFQANLFMMAMGNAQGNSITGLLSIVGYLGVFFFLNLTLIQGLFNMIFLLPDQVLSLIGAGGHGADLGKEVENRIHGLFLSGARMSNNLRTRVGGGGAAAAGAPKATPPAPAGGPGAARVPRVRLPNSKP